MSNGLIWAGLGKALSQAGSTVGGYMAQGIKDDEAERLLALREEAAEKRQMALLDAKEAKEEASAKREGLIVAEAEKSAKKVGEDRNFEKFKNAFRADEQGYPEMEKWSDERIRAAYDEQRGGGKDPEYTDKYSTQRQDVLDEIRRMGGKSKTIESAQSDVKIAQAAEAAQAKDERETRRLEGKEKYDEAKIKNDTLRAEAAVTAANRVGGSVAAAGERQERTLSFNSAKSKKETAENRLEAAERDLREFRKDPVRARNKADLEEYTGAVAAAKTKLAAAEAEMESFSATKKPASDGAKKEGQSSTKPAANTGTPKMNEEHTVASGEHKGKTAYWDGRGWKLK